MWICYKLSRNVVLARGGKDGGDVGRRAPLEGHPGRQRVGGRGDRGRYRSGSHSRQERQEVVEEAALHGGVLDARLGQAVNLQLALSHRLGPGQVFLSSLLVCLRLCGLKRKNETPLVIHFYPYGYGFQNVVTFKYNGIILFLRRN